MANTQLVNGFIVYSDSKLLATILGAFLAGIVGVLLHLFAEWRGKQKERKSDEEELESRLSQVLDYLSYLKEILEKYKDDYTPTHIILPFQKTLEIKHGTSNELLKIQSLYNKFSLKAHEMENDLVIQGDPEKLGEVGRTIVSRRQKELRKNILELVNELIKEVSSFLEKCRSGEKAKNENGGMGASFWARLKTFGSWRHFVGATISVLGTFIIFSPNIALMSKLYDKKISYFKSINVGIDKLTHYGGEPTEKDGRQREKELKVGDVGFNEILQILESAKPEKFNNVEIEQITSRREQTYLEGSGEYLDLLSLIHVKVKNQQIPYRLITTMSNLEVYVQIHKDRCIEGIGTLVIILGIFWPYIIQSMVVLFGQFKKKYA